METKVTEADSDESKEGWGLTTGGDCCCVTVGVEVADGVVTMAALEVGTIFSGTAV